MALSQDDCEAVVDEVLGAAGYQQRPNTPAISDDRVDQLIAQIKQEEKESYDRIANQNR